MSTQTPDLGAQDPELKNSPVSWDSDEEKEVLRQELADEPSCYFNDLAYAHGKTIKSGTELLRCDRGLWIPVGQADLLE